MGLAALIVIKEVGGYVCTACGPDSKEDSEIKLSVAMKQLKYRGLSNYFWIVWCFLKSLVHGHLCNWIPSYVHGCGNIAIGVNIYLQGKHKWHFSYQLMQKSHPWKRFWTIFDSYTKLVFKELHAHYLAQPIGNCHPFSYYLTFNLKFFWLLDKKETFLFQHAAQLDILDYECMYTLGSSNKQNNCIYDISNILLN